MKFRQWLSKNLPLFTSSERGTSEVVVIARAITTINTSRGSIAHVIRFHWPPPLLYYLWSDVIAMAASYSCSTCYNSWESYRVDGWVTCRQCGTDVWPYNRSDPEESDDSSDYSWLSSPSEYECYRCGNTWESRSDDGWATCHRCNKEVWPHNKSSPELSEDSDDEAACYRCSTCYNKWKSYHVDGLVICRDCGSNVWPYSKAYM